ncbi:MAG TPA: hypothetical protein VMW83_08685 [Spirochaetia bacterium]|nr:hypothetical protein [Spirochaetia bacterium]
MTEAEFIAAMRSVVRQELHPVNERLDRMDGCFDGVDMRLGAMDKRFDAGDSRMDRMENHMETLLEDMEILKTDMTTRKEDVSTIKTELRFAWEDTADHAGTKGSPVVNRAFLHLRILFNPLWRGENPTLPPEPG